MKPSITKRIRSLMISKINQFTIPPRAQSLKPEAKQRAEERQKRAKVEPMFYSQEKASALTLCDPTKDLFWQILRPSRREKRLTTTFWSRMRTTRALKPPSQER